ncbi:hypothetical protein [Chroococcidiopsis sp [FACHB-1243]]|nr:hypothetical protein [Chroococcidiopsis sp. [FACHB-1243]]
MSRTIASIVLLNDCEILRSRLDLQSFIFQQCRQAISLVLAKSD